VTDDGNTPRVEPVSGRGVEDGVEAGGDVLERSRPASARRADAPILEIPD